MFRYGYLSLLSFLLGGLLAAQHRVQETRLLAPRIGLQPRLLASGGLGSKLFAYSQSNQYGWSVLFCLEGEREVSILERPYDVPIGEDIYAVQVARDDSRIFFASGGPTSHFPTAIHSVRPDGSQLSTLVKSGDDCDEFVYPGYGTHLCSLPLEYQLSPDGRKILFVNKVREIRKLNDEERTRFYLSMVPVTGGPIVRLEEIGDGFDAVWSEDGTSIYYYYSRGRDPWNGVPRRYDLETGRSEFLTDEAWKALPPLAVSRADGALYFRSKQGFVRLDPETGEVEVIVEEHFDTFDLSPDGLRAVGIKEGDVTIVNLEFPSTARLVMETGTVDELELGQIPVARERWVIRKLRRGHSPSASEARKKTGVIGIRWLDNERLWCVVQEDRSTDPTRASKPEVRVGIVRLAN